MTLNSHIQNILKNSKKDTEWKKEAEERLQARNESKKSGFIATQLAIYLAEKGISQTALGEMTGVSPQQISKVLKGRENLTLATIEKIENALGIQLIQVNILEEAEIKRLELIKGIETLGEIGQIPTYSGHISPRRLEVFYSNISTLNKIIPADMFDESLQEEKIEIISVGNEIVFHGRKRALKQYQISTDRVEYLMSAESSEEYSKF